LRFHDGVTRVDALTRLAQTSHAALLATQVGYKVGSRTSTDVLRAADSFYANRRDLIRARYMAIVALLQLKAATATLDLNEVARVNGLLVGAEGSGVVAADRDAVMEKTDRSVAPESMPPTRPNDGPPVMTPFEALRVAQQRALAAAP
jgi:outer membrane protein